MAGLIPAIPINGQGVPLGIEIAGTRPAMTAVSAEASWKRRVLLSK
jgi:hypothetical protein